MAHCVADDAPTYVEAVSDALFILRQSSPLAGMLFSITPSRRDALEAVRRVTLGAHWVLAKDDRRRQL
jgi:hypothetical protein